MNAVTDSEKSRSLESSLPSFSSLQGKRKAQPVETEAVQVSKRIRTKNQRILESKGPTGFEKPRHWDFLNENDPGPGRDHANASSEKGVSISGSMTRRRASQEPAARTISFDEVYQGGEAEFKHIIIEFPPGQGQWYILRCDEHGVHFGRNPLLGAAKHINSIQHNNLAKKHSKAVELLGHLVLGCDASLAAKNNDAVKRAFDAGYTTYNVNRLTITQKIGQGISVENKTAKRSFQNGGEAATNDGQYTFMADKTTDKRPQTFTGITNPVPGELYLGYWAKNKTHYAIIVFPWDDLSIAGFGGSTLTTSALLQTVPRCYRVDRMTQQIKGWAKGYEDGGQYVNKREFPVTYFDGKRYVLAAGPFGSSRSR